MATIYRKDQRTGEASVMIPLDIFIQENLQRTYHHGYAEQTNEKTDKIIGYLMFLTQKIMNKEEVSVKDIFDYFAYNYYYILKEDGNNKD